MESFSLGKTFKNKKKGSVNINEKNSKVDAYEKDMEDNEEDIKNFALNMEFVIDFNANIINPKKDDKDIRDIISIFSKKIGKKINNTNKSAENTIFTFSVEFEKKVGNINKDTSDTTSDF